MCVLCWEALASSLLRPSALHRTLHRRWSLLLPTMFGSFGFPNRANPTWFRWVSCENWWIWYPLSFRTLESTPRYLYIAMWMSRRCSTHCADAFSASTVQTRSIPTCKPREQRITWLISELKIVKREGGQKESNDNSNKRNASFRPQQLLLPKRAKKEWAFWQTKRMW